MKKKHKPVVKRTTFSPAITNRHQNLHEIYQKSKLEVSERPPKVFSFGDYVTQIAAALTVALLVALFGLAVAQMTAPVDGKEVSACPPKVEKSSKAKTEKH